MLLGKEVPRADIPCTTCEIYLTMKANRKWLRRGWLFQVHSAVSTVYRYFGPQHSIALHEFRQRLGNAWDRLHLLP